MSLLGQDSITITDITDVNPIRLDLTSSQPIYQTKKTGENYEPDYTVSPLIITPSLYFGTREVSEEEYRNKIEFYIDGILIENTEEIYVENSSLYIKQNLTGNIKVEANIRNITDTTTKVTYEEIKNSISFYYLSYDSSGYTVFIDSKDGRYDFSANNSNRIILEAHLFAGISELTPTSYEWKRSSGEQLTNNTNKTLSIERKDIYSHENFICIIDYNGVSYTATCAIDDRTDLYTGAIISNTSLVMTPIFKSAELTCKIFRNGEEINISDDAENFKYSWVFYGIGEAEGTPIGGNSKIINITIGENGIPKDNFTIYCITKIDEKYTVVSYLPINYSVSYTPILTPKTIFIPANYDGSYQGEELEIEKNLTFFLQDESGSQIESNLTNFSINGKEGIIIGDYTNVENKIYTIPFSINALNFKDYDVSELFELSYYYKEQSFNEEFYIVKSVQGNNGKDGASGSSYSLILSNDYHRFAGKEAFADANQEASTKIQFYRGDELMTLKDIKIRDITLTTVDQTVIEGLYAKLDIDTDATEKTITFITGGAGNRLAQGGTLSIEVDVEINGEIKTFSTGFA